MKKIKWPILVGFILALIGFLLILRFSLSKAFNDGSGILDTDLLYKFGGLIGGLVGPIFSLAGFLLIYETIVAQRLSFENQQTSFKIQQFENQFFQMLRLHKENVDELNIRSVIDGKEVSRRQAFVTMADEFKTFLSYIKFDSLSFLKEYKIAYDIFFWGWSSNYVGLDSLSNAWVTIKNGPDPTSGDYDHTIDFREYKGYSSSLGHYFRHLFMMVKYVAYSDVITEYKDKMKYLKILRAQLSNHEQIMLFYNWLSTGYGGAWEDEENNFFTEYKMIHNLWVDELYQDQYIIDAVNNLIDKHNRNAKGTPLFEFQEDNPNLKMKKI